MSSQEHIRLGIKRSSKWRRVELAHLKIEPGCRCCRPGASAKGLQVHHIFPFHYVVQLGRPDLELDHRNLITLCESEKGKPGPNHHLLVGHLDDFKTANLRVVLDVTQTFHGMTRNSIRTDHRWLTARAAKLTPLDEMSDIERKHFRQALDALFPKKS